MNFFNVCFPFNECMMSKSRKLFFIPTHVIQIGLVPVKLGLY